MKYPEKRIRVFLISRKSSRCGGGRIGSVLRECVEAWRSNLTVGQFLPAWKIISELVWLLLFVISNLGIFNHALNVWVHSTRKSTTRNVLTQTKLSVLVGYKQQKGQNNRTAVWLKSWMPARSSLRENPPLPAFRRTTDCGVFSLCCYNTHKLCNTFYSPFIIIIVQMQKHLHL